MGQATSQPQSDFLALDMAGPGGNMQSMQMMEQEVSALTFFVLWPVSSEKAS